MLATELETLTASSIRQLTGSHRRVRKAELVVLISLADLCPEPMGCVSVLLSLLTVREKTKTNR